MSPVHESPASAEPASDCRELPGQTPLGLYPGAATAGSQAPPGRTTFWQARLGDRYGVGPSLLVVMNAAAVLGSSTATIGHLIAAGKLPGARLARHIQTSLPAPKLKLLGTDLEREPWGPPASTWVNSDSLAPPRRFGGVVA